MIRGWGMVCPDWDHGGPFRHRRWLARKGGGVDIGALDLAAPGFSSAWAARFAGCRGFAA
jgi:hypothetical protein